MLPFLADTFGNPSARTAGAATRGARSTTPATRWPTCSARSRARSCSPAAAPRPTTWRSSASLARTRRSRRVLGGRAPRRARAGRAVRRPRRGRRPPTASSTSTRWPMRSTTTSRVVSVMLVNNEVGMIQPLDAGRRARAPSALPAPCCTPTRCRPSPWLDVAARRAPTPTWSRSARHKFGGPKGVGVLVDPRRHVARPAAARRRPGARAAQRHAERGRHRGHGRGRPQCGATTRAIAGRPARRRCRDRLRRRAARRPSPGTVETGVTGIRRRPRTTRSPAPATSASAASRARRCCSCSTRPGIAASAASSCASGAMEPSHVLAAMGVDRALAGGSLRLSLGWPTTEADVDLALDVVPRRRRVRGDDGRRTTRSPAAR